jgi:hypothetical protein
MNLRQALPGLGLLPAEGGPKDALNLPNAAAGNPGER